MAKIGAILGGIGSTIFLIVGLFTISMARMYYSAPSYIIIVSFIAGIATITLAACGLVGAVLVFRDINTAGYTILIIAGAAGIIATFIPIYIYDHGYGYLQLFYLCNTALYSDLVLMLIGGILGFALAEKKERKDS